MRFCYFLKRIDSTREMAYGETIITKDIPNLTPYTINYSYTECSGKNKMSYYP